MQPLRLISIIAVFASSQSDSEQADLYRERRELDENAEFELEELAEIYVKRGVDGARARQAVRRRRRPRVKRKISRTILDGIDLQGLLGAWRCCSAAYTMR